MIHDSYGVAIHCGRIRRQSDENNTRYSRAVMGAHMYVQRRLVAELEYVECEREPRCERREPA